MNRVVSTVLTFIAIIIAYIFFLAGAAAPDLLSPQGCRMSYMSPSYILQVAFDASWTPLATRYSLWLYREVGWDGNQPSGTPVLFIPGNAGSSHQVRSIASSATRQYFHSPHFVSPEFASRGMKPLDVYAVEFNEDLSAFHGPTLLAERSYVLESLRYIASLYPENTQVLILGHSMGGVVATSLLPSTNISAIITMSTPHTIPPARFDRRIEEIFRDNQARLKNDPTPIISLCGGATDLMIPSESCVLPNPAATDIYRSTLFTSALEGCWTGVGHREMVWCHQVRWQVARAALELSGVSTLENRAAVLDKWLKDGHHPPTNSTTVLDPMSDLAMPSEIVPSDKNLILTSPSFSGSRLFFHSNPRRRGFVLYVSQGNVRSISPHHPSSLRVEIFSCQGIDSDPPVFSPSTCATLDFSNLRLLPETQVDQKFPVPQVGSDESQGIVLFEAELSHEDFHKWIVLKVDGADGRGWLAGGFIEPDQVIQADVSTMTLLLYPADISLLSLRSTIHSSPLKTNVYLPHLLSNVLVTYRLTPQFPEFCSHKLLPPLLLHTTPSEVHYHRLLPSTAAYSRPVLLHTHSSAPFMTTGPRYGVNLTIYTSGEEDECFPTKLRVQIDWWSTIGRWGHRYWSAAVTWCVGIVSLIIWQAMGTAESTQGNMPSVSTSLSMFNRALPYLLLGASVLSFLPLPTNAWLGNIGEPVFALIAPLLIIICTGLVNLSWWILTILMFIAGSILRPARDANRAMKPRKLRITITSTIFICVIVSLFIPWQVAFLGSWIIHFYTCVISSHRLRFASTNETELSPSPPLTSSSTWIKPPHVDYTTDNHNHSSHVFLLMTWLLPLTAPVLAVWVRTLATAGWATPFDGDHNFLYVAPFLFFVDWSWTCVRKHGKVKLFQTSRIEKVSARWLMAVIAFVAFIYGPRFNYLIFDYASINMGMILVLRVGSRYYR